MKTKLGSAILLCGAAASLAAPPPPPTLLTPAPYTPVRWNEDYSYLEDASKKSDFFDPIKYVPLGPEDFYLSLGGQFRERYEYFSNNNFDVGPQDGDGYYLTRILLHADLHATKFFRFFVEGKSATIDDRVGGPRGTDSDEADLEQAFFDFNLPLGAAKDNLTVRIGRQDLFYGAQRLISPLDWTNVRRTFQGIKGAATVGKATVDAFWVNPVTITNEEPNDGNDNIGFWGVYGTYALTDLITKGDGSKVEAYFLGLNIVEGGAAAVDSDTYTIGARFSTKPKPWDFDIEADYQFGKFGQLDTSAWSVAIEGGYTFDKVKFQPKAYIGFDIASGDDSPTDGDRNTFNQLFPLGHAYFGYIDVIARQNIVDAHPGIELTLVQKQKYIQKLTARGEYHQFWRESENDAVYNAGGALLRGAGGSGEMHIGSEIDLLVNWQVDRHAALQFGYSHFFAGAFLRDTGSADDIDFVYTAFQYTF